MKNGPSDFSLNQKANDILDVIMAYARLDFSQKITLSDNNDVFDAIGAGVNMLGEELQISTISLKEKEQLLKEIHHRVKNNLQIVSSLLSLQSVNVFDENYLSLIKESRNRINSMALVHEMLYTSKDLGKIDLRKYIISLTSSIHQSFAAPDSKISVRHEIEDHIVFEIDRMIPIGLILNEIISNAFKYAFPDNRIGIISIAFAIDPSGYLLSVSDNGVGLPSDFEARKKTSLGMQLIHMLGEQIDAKVAIDSNKGTAIKIEFPR